MRKSMSMAAAVALLVLAGSAHAAEISGRIENIDLTRNTFSVGDHYFQWSSMNSLGPRLNDLQNGEQVTVRYDRNQDGTNDVARLDAQQPVAPAEVVLEVVTEE
jgi:predicted porin